MLPPEAPDPQPPHLSDAWLPNTTGTLTWTQVDDKPKGPSALLSAIQTGKLLRKTEPVSRGRLLSG